MQRPLIRNYDPAKEAKAAHRIWRETAWVTEDEQEKAMDVFLSNARVLVAELGGEPECLAAAMDAEMAYLDETLSVSVVASVTTSRVARKRRLAQYTTAQLIAEEAEAGAAVSTLGIFEQGFYNQLGYGSGGYEHWIAFDPAELMVKQDFRVPKRLGKDDYKAIHQSLLDRKRSHGSVFIKPPEFYQGETMFDSKAFGLGYFDGEQGELTHFFWINPGDGEHGPYRVIAMAFQANDQLLELLALIKSLGDQVRLVKMDEPAGVQLQDFIRHPFRAMMRTEHSRNYESQNRALSYWQMRICDLDACLARTHLNCDELSFNLELSDPIEDLLPEDVAWRGIGGNYVVTLGPNSSAKTGVDGTLPTLKASVGAFTRLWLGVQPATGLAVTDNLSGPTELLDTLERSIRLPQPHPGLDY